MAWLALALLAQVRRVLVAGEDPPPAYPSRGTGREHMGGSEAPQ